MYPAQRYREQQSVGWSRIDLLIALYDAGIERLEAAQQTSSQGNGPAAAAHLVRAQRIVAELMAGLDLQFGDLPRNLQRLYHFVLRAITGPRPNIEPALQVLRTLREGLQAIRSEAVQLERAGAIPAIGDTTTFRATG